MTQPLLKSKFFIHDASSSLTIVFNVTVTMEGTLLFSVAILLAEDTENEGVLGE